MVLLLWDATVPGAVWHMTRRVEACLSRGMRVARRHANALLLVQNDDLAKVWAAADDTTWIYGDHHAREGEIADLAAIGQSHPASARSVCQCLNRAVWGRYAAIVRDPAGGTIVFAEPMGSMPLFQIDEPGARIVTTSLSPDMAGWLLARRPAIDWDAAANLTVNPFGATQRCALEGVTMVPPGQAWDPWSGHGEHSIWGPPEAMDVGAPCAQGLQDMVRGVLRDRFAGHRQIALELSGGFDSTLLLGALREAAPDTDLVALHYAMDTRDGFETARARAVAARVDVELIEIPATAAGFDWQRLIDMRCDAQPRLAWFDMTQDLHTSSWSQDHDGAPVVTGQGGDALFYQFPTALIVNDLIAQRGLAAPWPHALWDCARRRGSSIWPLLLEMARGYQGPRIAPAMACQALGERGKHAMAHREVHPWQQLPADLPGKRLQLASLADSQLAHGPSWAGDSGRLVHPLMSQPIVEACLQIPSWQLAHGVESRAFARSAFDCWLMSEPSPVKGSAAGYYCRCVLSGLPLLRALLLEGGLVARGVLDRAQLEAILQPENLIVGQHYRSIATWASLEAWARAWS